jgi:hypothetical protein
MKSGRIRAIGIDLGDNEFGRGREPFAGRALRSRTLPALLHGGTIIMNVLWQQNPRNRRIAEALGKCGLVERARQGFELIFSIARIIKHSCNGRAIKRQVTFFVSGQ